MKIPKLYSKQRLLGLSDIGLARMLRARPYATDGTSSALQQGHCAQLRILSDMWDVRQCWTEPCVGGVGGFYWDGEEEPGPMSLEEIEALPLAELEVLLNAYEHKYRFSSSAIQSCLRANLKDTWQVVQWGLMFAKYSREAP